MNPRVIFTFAGFHAASELLRYRDLGATGTLAISGPRCYRESCDIGTPVLPGLSRCLMRAPFVFYAVFYRYGNCQSATSPKTYAAYYHHCYRTCAHLNYLLFHIVFSLFFGRDVIGITFFTFHDSKDDCRNNHNRYRAPAEYPYAEPAVVAVSFGKEILDIHDGHKAQYEDGDDLKRPGPPFPDAEIGKTVCFLPEFFRIEEPAYQDYFQDTGHRYSYLIGKGIDNIQYVKPCTRYEQKTEQKSRNQNDRYSLFVMEFKFILHARNYGLCDRHQRSDTGHQEFGVIETDPDDRGHIKAFVEKPKETPGLPDSPDEVLASMGNYIMNADALTQAVTVDADDESSKHDMGGNIVPWFVDQGAAGVYDFKDNDVPGATERDRDYWRDVGTVDAFYEAHQDLISVSPVFNLYNAHWPLFAGYMNSMPPAKFVYGHHERLGHAVDSIVSPGVIVSGGEVISSVLSPEVRVNSWSSVRESVLMDGVIVGRNTVVNRAILDKYVVVEEGAMVGIDPEHDRERGFTVTESGITVVAKGQKVTR